MRRLLSAVIAFAWLVLPASSAAGGVPVRDLLRADWPAGWSVGTTPKTVDVRDVHRLMAQVIADGTPRRVAMDGPVATQARRVERMRNEVWTEFGTRITEAIGRLMATGKADVGPHVLALTYSAAYPTTLSYQLFGRERHMFLPASRQLHTVYVPMEKVGVSPDLGWHATPELLVSEVRISELALVSVHDRAHAELCSMALFLDRIFHPYAASFSLPGGVLPLGTHGVNSSFFQSWVDGEENTIRPTLLVAGGSSVATEFVLDGGGELELWFDAVPFAAMDRVVAEVRLVRADGTAKRLVREERDLSALSGGAAWNALRVAAPISGEVGERVRLEFTVEAAGGAPGTPGAIGLFSGIRMRGGSAEEREPKGRDVVMVIADSLRAQTAYDERLQRPGRGLARLMAMPDTAVFTRAHSPSNTTTPSTNALLHGRYLAEFPIFYHPAQETNLFAYFRSQGYRTYCVTTNPYLIPRLEFFTDEYVYYRDIMDGDRLFARAAEILSRRDADGRPAFVFLQAMETHSPDAFGRVRSDCMDKPEVMRRFAQYLGVREPRDTPETTLAVDSSELDLRPCANLSDDFGWDAASASVVFSGAKRLLLEGDAVQMLAAPDGSEPSGLSLSLRFDPPDLAARLERCEMNLFHRNGRNQLYGVMAAEPLEPGEVRLSRRVKGLVVGGPDEAPFPVEEYTGALVVQLHFSESVSGRATISGVRAVSESRDFMAFMDGVLDRVVVDEPGPDAEGVSCANRPLSKGALLAARKGYVTKWMAFDAKFDAFLDALDGIHDGDGPVMLFFADHGQSLGENGKYGHGSSLGNQQIRVPLVVHVPGGLDGRRLRVDSPVETLSVYATMVHLFGGVSAGPLRGESLLRSALDGDGPERVAVSQIDTRQTARQIAVITPHGKAIVDLDGERMQATTNDDHDGPLDVVPAGLFERARWVGRWYGALGAAGARAEGQAETTRLDQTLDQNLKALKDLGYVE
ncbi:hypothetical protein GGQ74_002355 [Desulfobaculum xiamenense]|uniref:Sulfatase N-terminal domain-containing protein n=1 Tax=Desulfobaculum xiamenense TaxID=995050 RepID=A0A846QQA5_9BACT|nr:sulfatase-like hydrolase/transferase [Desulfobaculum xiamenense]NJB68682.1 hypothetical protein [Desulfobaculum xiamenense]